MEQESNTKNPWTAFILSATVFVAIVALVYPFRAILSREFRNIRLTPTPEHYTELYFDSHNDLPKKIEVGKVNSFSFVIHNVEGKSTEYEYEVYMQDESGQRVDIYKGKATLSDGETRTFNQAYTLKHPHTKEIVYVVLKKQNQAIHFQITE